MKYGSICSGIEAATQAWHHLGWEPAFFSEIDKFPRAVLEHHYPEVPLHGDFTTIGADEYGPIQLLVGGTPCQSFSVAGLRGGLDDDRGNLALEFLRLAQRTRPRWLVWENVPGVLSSNGGRDFGSILGGLVELGYGFAYRVLDAQYFGVAQRRRRVFVVGSLGDWRRASAVLFERESVRGNPPPSRKAEQGTAPDVAKSLRGNSGGIDRKDMHTLIPSVFAGNTPTETAATLETTSHDYSRADSFHCVTVHGTQDPDLIKEAAHPLGRNQGQENAIAFMENQRGEVRTDDIAGTITTPGGKPGQGYPAVAFKPSHYTRGKDGAPSAVSPPLSADADKGDQEAVIQVAMQVRRLTPVECERLQGFPDNYTRIPYRNKAAENCPDGPRYKALGNSMAVPVMRWIGERIQKVDSIMAEEKAIEILSDMNFGG